MAGVHQLLLHTATTPAVYIEDVFSTWLYSGTGIAQTITNGIDLASPTKGGLVWLKSRSGTTDHALYDTVRGATFDLASNLTAIQSTQAQGLTSFASSGFTLGTLAKVNTNSALYASWTFGRQAKFFDVVAYTGNGANRTINHNLGSVPGCIIIKNRTSAFEWIVYHRVNGATQFLQLESTTTAVSDVGYWNNTNPTATVFTVGTKDAVNRSGDQFVAYLFAHDAGGFGATGTDNVISCGSYTGNGSATSGPTVSLGWEPQWLLIKNRTQISDWNVLDNVRGFIAAGTDRELNLNQTSVESSLTAVTPTATGFQINTNSTEYNATSSVYVYVAIRRGPMRTPTSGTSVFVPTVYTGTNTNNRLVNTTIPPDMVWVRQRDDAILSGMVVGDRLRGQPYWLTDATGAEVTTATAFDQQLVSATEYGSAFASMNGVWVGSDATAKLNASPTANNHIVEAFRRAPGFFDIVCYTGTGATAAINHNLGVVPEFLIVKNRSAAGSAQALITLSGGLTGALTSNAPLGAPSATVWGNGTVYVPPTASVFTVGTATTSNSAGANYVVYLFASCPGVSKVGTYIGNGAGNSVAVDCGFTSGARFILIKAVTTDNMNWNVWDSARGIVSSIDPYLTLNTPAAEAVTSDWVDPLATGFQVSGAADSLINDVGQTYAFFAIA